MPDGVDQVRRNSRVACRGGEASCISRWTWNEGCAVLRCGRFERWRDACHVHRAWRSVQLQSAAEAGSANRLFEKGVARFGARLRQPAKWLRKARGPVARLFLLLLPRPATTEFLCSKSRPGHGKFRSIFLSGVPA